MLSWSWTGLFLSNQRISKMVNNLGIWIKWKITLTNMKEYILRFPKVYLDINDMRQNYQSGLLWSRSVHLRSRQKINVLKKSYKNMRSSAWNSSTYIQHVYTDSRGLVRGSWQPPDRNAGLICTLCIYENLNSSSSKAQTENYHWVCTEASVQCILYMSVFIILCMI